MQDHLAHGQQRCHGDNRHECAARQPRPRDVEANHASQHEERRRFDREHDPGPGDPRRHHVDDCRGGGHCGKRREQQDHGMRRRIPEHAGARAPNENRHGHHRQRALAQVRRRGALRDRQSQADQVAVDDRQQDDSNERCSWPAPSDQAKERQPGQADGKEHGRRAHRRDYGRATADRRGAPP
jgi:hypothetical protein